MDDYASDQYIFSFLQGLRPVLHLSLIHIFMRSPVFLLSFLKNHRLPRQYSYLPQSPMHIKMYLVHNSMPDVNSLQQHFSYNNKACFLESVESPMLQKMKSKYSCNYAQVSPHISRFQKLLPMLGRTHLPRILCR